MTLRSVVLLKDTNIIYFEENDTVAFRQQITAVGTN